jgi:hypothetical protein
VTPEKAAADVNSLCKRCVRSCRQTSAITLVECPRFQPRPFKITAYRFDQLDLFGAPAQAKPQELFSAKTPRGKKRRKEEPENLF